MTRAAIYARYSSDNQREASIEDQVRQCQARIEREGWKPTEIYSDHAISGASTLRPGYQKMLEDARAGRFDCLVAEALDRLSRDQADIAGLYKHLSFADVTLFTLSEGEVNELHVGLKGTMNALFLKDLADKTRRGLEGRVRKGKSGGGLCYGYDVVRSVNASGEPDRGGRSINLEQAAIVVRIFKEFVSGRSPKAIAHTLNRENVPGPSGGAWGPSTIYGNWRRGTGILNNELYAGKIVWNKQHYIKDPSTGKRQARRNPESEWVVEEVPDLRIVDHELWQAVKARQNSTRGTVTTDQKAVRPERARRPRYLLSGLLKCGFCMGGYPKISATHYGCSTARNKGTCDNRLAIKRLDLENAVLEGLKDHLMHPDCVRAFVAEFHAEINRLAAAADTERDKTIKDLERVDREIGLIVQAIKDGVPALTLKNELTDLEARKRKLEQSLENAPAPVVRLHPNLADLYSQKVADLTNALNAESQRHEAFETIRGLIEEVRLVPLKGKLEIELYGELSALINLANKNPRFKETEAQVTLVAGAGFVQAPTIQRFV